MKSKRLLIICVCLLLFPLLLGAGEEEKNLLKNASLALSGGEVPDGWTISGDGQFEFLPDTDGEGARARIVMDASGQASLEQNVSVAPERAYRIRFDARVTSFTGYDGAFVQIPGVEGTQSETNTTDEWKTVEIYGMTSPDQELLTVAFSFGVQGRGDQGVAEFRNLSVVNVTAPPDGAQYVWFYDQEAWEEQNEKEEKSNPFPIGTMQAFGIAAVYYLVLLNLQRGKSLRPQKPKQGKKKPKAAYVYIMLGATASIILALTTYGHGTDMTDFSLWAKKLGDVGLSNFYTSDIWCDYPPGYMYVLFTQGSIAKLIGAQVGSPMFNLLIKLPMIVCDAITALFIYRIAHKRIGEKPASILAGIIALNPMVLFETGIWGQIDSVLTLCVLGMFWAWYTNKKELSVVLCVIGLLIKPQMLIFGPVLLAAFVCDIMGPNYKRELFVLLRSVLAGVATFVLLVLPFMTGQEPLWLLDKYFGTASSYPYASTNAYNIYAMLGLNWVDYSQTVLGVSLKTIGNIFIILVSIGAGALLIGKQKRRMVFPAAMFMMWGIFMLSHSMHERYLFPVMALAAVSFVVTRDRRFITLLGISTAVLLGNCVVSMLSPHLMGIQPLIIIIGSVNLIGFIYCVYVCCTVKPTEYELVEKPQQLRNHEREKLPGMPRVVHTGMPSFIRVTNRRGERMTRKDYLLMLLVTAVYGVVAFVNLGTTEVPQSYWRTKQADETAIVELDKQAELGHVFFYPGVGEGNLSISLSTDGKEFSPSYSVQLKYGQMYVWQRLDTPGQAKYLRISSEKENMFINEMAVFDKDGNMLSISSVHNDPQPEGEHGDVQALFDEQQLVNTEPTYLDEMYFDEIYHARTAFEHLNGMEPYENSHPPLGKIFIMLGIIVFGMNPFGWRIVGTVFGIGMLPLMFVFAKRIFKDTRYATISTVLFALDGMHFAQTRIATIDVYGVFFIMAMCYFMYRYWQMNFFVDGFGKTLLPLGLSGLMFGIGCASKWIGFYAGAGLAVLLFSTFVVRYREYKKAIAALEDGSETCVDFLLDIRDTFWPKIFKTCLFCVGTFIIIPVAIYLLSYIPYFLCIEKPYDLKGVWGVQEFMLSYHSQLTDTHPFQTPWYEWPVIVRPIYYYKNSYLPETLNSTIASFGNPGVWWSGLLATIVCLVKLCMHDKRLDRENVKFIVVCLAAAYLPWALITRATFIYHYFASVPFIILLTVMLMKCYPRKRTGKVPLWGWGILIVSAALFVLFYPVWSGMVIDRQFALTFIRWFPSWWFF